MKLHVSTQLSDREAIVATKALVPVYAMANKVSADPDVSLVCRLAKLLVAALWRLTKRIAKWAYAMLKKAVVAAYHRIVS